MALAHYQHTWQYMPYERMKELFADVLGLPVSNGTPQQLAEQAGR